MKRGLQVLFLVSIILVLSLSIISASWFTDFFAKITGKATEKTYTIIDKPNVTTSFAVLPVCSDSISMNQFCTSKGYDGGEIGTSYSGGDCAKYEAVQGWIQSQSTLYSAKCYNNVEVTATCVAGDTCLDSNKVTSIIVTFNNYAYAVELISASDTSATIKVTNGGASQTKEINEGTSKEIQGLNVTLKSASVDSISYLENVVLQLSYISGISGTLTCEEGYTCLSSDSAKTIVTFDNINYEVELLSATDASATIEVTTTGGQGVAKEFSVGQTKEINGLNVYVKNADETNLKFSATLQLSLATASCTDSDGGINYYVKGVVTKTIIVDSLEQTTADYCAPTSDTSVIEFYCDKNDNASSIRYPCPNGCLDGACVRGEEAIYIIEQDFGVDYEKIIKYNPDSLESDENAEGVDELSAYFKGFIYGESARYYFGDDLNDGFVVTVAEFDHILSFEEFNSLVQSTEENPYITELEYFDLEEIGLKGIFLVVGEIHQYVNYWYISDNKIVIIGNALEDSIEQNDDSFVEFLRAYLDKYPSTLNPDEDKDVEDITSCDSGCVLDEQCYPYGFRKSGNYCYDITKTFIAQKEKDAEGNWATCENHFECQSNVCYNGECVERTFLQKVVDWLGGILKLFGFD